METSVRSSRRGHAERLVDLLLDWPGLAPPEPDGNAARSTDGTPERTASHQSSDVHANSPKTTGSGKDALLREFIGYCNAARSTDGTPERTASHQSSDVHANSPKTTGSGKDALLREFIGYCIVLPIVLFGVSLLSNEEFSLSVYTEKFNQYFAFTYPHCTSGLSCIWTSQSRADEAAVIGASPPASVVLWNDSRMAREEEWIWPLRMETHAAVLQGLLRYGPKAVLVDLLFADDPQERGDDTLQDLVDVVHEYEEAGIPLYFADTGEVDVSVVDPLKDALGDTGLVSVALATSSTQTAYRAAVDSGTGAMKRNGAVAIHHVENVPPVSPGASEFQLFWGGRSSDFNKKLWKCDEFEMPDSFHAAFSRLFSDVAGKLLSWSATDDQSSFDDGRRPACPYTPVIPADLLADSPLCVPSARNPESRCNAITKRYLELNSYGVSVGDSRA